MLRTRASPGTRSGRLPRSSVTRVAPGEGRHPPDPRAVEVLGLRHRLALGAEEREVLGQADEGGAPRGGLLDEGLGRGEVALHVGGGRHLHDRGEGAGRGAHRAPAPRPVAGRGAAGRSRCRYGRAAGPRPASDRRPRRPAAARRGPGLPALPRAHGEQRADAAGRPARVADLAAVEDEEVGRPRPALAGDERHELRLDLQRVVALGEAEAVRHAEDVGVHGDALVDAEGVAEDHVRGLAADAGQGDERVHASAAPRRRDARRGPWRSR